MARYNVVSIKAYPILVCVVPDITHGERVLYRHGKWFEW